VALDVDAAQHPARQQQRRLVAAADAAAWARGSMVCRS